MLIKKATLTDLTRVNATLPVAFPYEPYHAEGGIRVRWVPDRNEDYKKAHGHYRYQRRSAGWQNTERKIWALCWHGYREVFRALFKIAPEARVYTALAKRAGIKYYSSENFERVFLETGLVNIGSQVMPVQAREACFCSETGDDLEPFDPVRKLKKGDPVHYEDDNGTALLEITDVKHGFTELGSRATQIITSPVTKVISQQNLTAECWLVQIQGKQACKTCEARDTEDCGGVNILKTGKNEKGLAVPVS